MTEIALSQAGAPPTELEGNDKKLAATAACVGACAASHVGCMLSATFNILGAGASGFTNSLALSSALATGTSLTLYGLWYMWWSRTQKPHIQNEQERRDIPRNLAVMMAASTVIGVGFMALPISWAAGTAATAATAASALTLKKATTRPLAQTARRLGVTFAIAIAATSANVASKVPLDALVKAYEMTNVPNMPLRDKYRLATDYITFTCLSTPPTPQSAPAPKPEK